MITCRKPQKKQEELSAVFWTGDMPAQDKWMGEMNASIKRVGLLGGSFNPIHYGHTGLANYVLENTDIQQIWLMVSPQNPLKRRADLMPDDVRLSLARKAVASMPNIKVCDIEMQLPIPSYTVNTLAVLRQMYPNVDFTLIIGSDNVLCFNKWYKYQEILDKHRVMVYPRPGYDATELISTKYPSMMLIDAPQFNISSTEIREGKAESSII
ncbi:MAG: nicotinate-nucleotide adenylyltransferase [Paludibacteraceae bacterium]|nr:nicotinate-nucleotide adenylyltransferase [Paludibacteraceae bacterium]